VEFGPPFKGENMNTIENFTSSLADETGVTGDVAEKIVQWLTEDGVLDFAVIEETYNA
jgi:ribosomal protein S25